MYLLGSDPPGIEQGGRLGNQILELQYILRNENSEPAYRHDQRMRHQHQDQVDAEDRDRRGKPAGQAEPVEPAMHRVHRYDQNGGEENRRHNPRGGLESGNRDRGRGQNNQDEKAERDAASGGGVA